MERILMNINRREYLTRLIGELRRAASGAEDREEILQLLTFMSLQNTEFYSDEDINKIADYLEGILNGGDEAMQEKALIKNILEVDLERVIHPEKVPVLESMDPFIRKALDEAGLKFIRRKISYDYSVYESVIRGARDVRLTVKADRVTRVCTIKATQAGTWEVITEEELPFDGEMCCVEMYSGAIKTIMEFINE